MQILPIIGDGSDPEGFRVLVAEDGTVHQRLILWLLRQSGCCVTIVDNGKDVLGRLHNHTYDVILMDVEMPVLDGLAATRRIRAFEANSGTHVPIIAVTDRDNAEECLQAGMDAYLPKPVSNPGLCQMLTNVLSSRKRTEPTRVC
jgi:CheY-like chemotaxis protein